MSDRLTIRFDVEEQTLEMNEVIRFGGSSSGGVTEEEVLQIIEHNSSEVDTLELVDVELLNVGKSDNYNAESDNEVLTAKATSQVVDNAEKEIKDYVQQEIQKLSENTSTVETGVEITYTELKKLRDMGKLVAGTNYIITDYQCTTITEFTKSGNHQFDIIVVADSNDTLNESARARKHKGDTYFETSNLSAWELKYCLDNDTTRFAWADEINGKGVIYYMKDEWDNEVPYDFKNIMYCKMPTIYIKKSYYGNGSYSRTRDYDLTFENENYYSYGGKYGYYVKDEIPTLDTQIYEYNTYTNIIKILDNTQYYITEIDDTEYECYTFNSNLGKSDNVEYTNVNGSIINHAHQKMWASGNKIKPYKVAIDSLNAYRMVLNDIRFNLETINNYFDDNCFEIYSFKEQTCYIHFGKGCKHIKIDMIISKDFGEHFYINASDFKLSYNFRLDEVSIIERNSGIFAYGYDYDFKMVIKKTTDKGETWEDIE